jgi:hypothetical protein
MIDVEQLLSSAVSHFWRTRSAQRDRQGIKSGTKDAGQRSAVTGGKHADGFVRLIAAVVEDAELPNWKVRVHTTIKKHRTLPGYFRPSKEWDVVVLSGSDVIAVIEVKSQVGSFGNNFNNRVEEAVGNATDFWMAYSKGIFEPSARPWLGYLFMLEECPASLRKTKRILLEPFGVDESFQELSYSKRYELVCLRMVRELLYDSACFFTSNSSNGLAGKFEQPNAELSVRNFAASLHSRAAAFAKMK